MNALHGMARYWKAVVGEYMKEWYKSSIALQYFQQEVFVLNDDSKFGVTDILKPQYHTVIASKLVGSHKSALFAP